MAAAPENAGDLHVFARRVCAPAGQYAVVVDLRLQCRGRHGRLALSGVLPAVRRRSRLCAGAVRSALALSHHPILHIFIQISIISYLLYNWTNAHKSDENRVRQMLEVNMSTFLCIELPNHPSSRYIKHSLTPLTFFLTRGSRGGLNFGGIRCNSE